MLSNLINEKKDNPMSRAILEVCEDAAFCVELTLRRGVHHSFQWTSTEGNNPGESNDLLRV